MKIDFLGDYAKVVAFFLAFFDPLSKVSGMLAATSDKPAFGCLLAANTNYNITGV